MVERKVIYDFGANNGDDIPYYLQKADLVVAVDAHPGLTNHIRKRFPGEVQNGNLIIENCVLSETETHERVSFYLHNKYHVLNTFPKPSLDKINEYHEITLYARTPSSIVNYYGEPYYIKVDIEHYDANVIRNLFENNIKPKYISAEIHHIDVFAIIVAQKEYQSFKLVDGKTVNTLYGNHKIETARGVIDYSFPHHSAGPFGNDIIGPWLNADDAFAAVAQSGLGWKDFHASRVGTDTPLHPTGNEPA